MKVTPNYEKKVTKVTLVLENEKECASFMYILNRATLYPRGDTAPDEIEEFAKLLYSKIYQ